VTSTIRKLRRARLREVIRVTAQISGCTCNPDVVLHGMTSSEARHDSWCPLATAGRQYVIYDDVKGCNHDRH
jgi:hypothetical protein